MSDANKVAIELVKLAREVAGGQSMPDEIVPGENPNIEDEHKAALAKMEKKLDRIDKGVRTIFFKKGRALAFNINMTGGGNFMGFSILPLFWKRQSYSSKDNTLYIKPGWHSGEKSYRSYHIPELADHIVKAIGKSRTVKEVVDGELDDVEKAFGIDIPTKTRALILKYALKLQKSRLTARTIGLKPKPFVIEE